MNLNILLFLSLNGLVAYAALAPRSNAVLTEQLYNSVVVGDYDNAVKQSIQLENEDKGAVITEAVNKLLGSNKRSVFEYAYKLWNTEAKEIVKHYFPIQFRVLLDGNYVKLINKRDNLAVKLGEAKDTENDRHAYGDSIDKTSERISWKFEPVWENQRVFFKIVSIKYNQYLKLAKEADSMGDHQAFGDDKADTLRHQWYVQPAKYDNDLLFFIYNRENNQPLKLSRAVDDEGDRTLYGHKGAVLGNPELYGWYITPV